MRRGKGGGGGGGARRRGVDGSPGGRLGGVHHVSTVTYSRARWPALPAPRGPSSRGACRRPRPPLPRPCLRPSPAPAHPWAQRSRAATSRSPAIPGRWRLLLLRRTTSPITRTSSGTHQGRTQRSCYPTEPRKSARACADLRGSVGVHAGKLGDTHAWRRRAARPSPGCRCRCARR